MIEPLDRFAGPRRPSLLVKHCRGPMSGRTIEELFVAPEFLPARIAMRKAARAALLEGTAPAPPELLHFTDLDGLVGIVENGELWATYAHALNDESEIRYGIEQVRKAIHGMEAEAPSALYEPCLRALEIDRAYWMAMAQPFVVSFCATETSGHWLHYGRSGTGVAMRFRSDGLKAHPSAALLPVVYRPEEQQQLVGRVIAAVHGILQRLCEASPDATTPLTELARGVAHSYLVIAATMMKDTSFSRDDEWRLIHLRGGLLPTSHVSDPVFRCSNGRVRPHVEVSWQDKTLPYVGTILGHSCREESRSPSLRALLWHRYHLLAEEFARSQIKVRP